MNDGLILSMGVDINAFIFFYLFIRCQNPSSDNNDLVS